MKITVTAEQPQDLKVAANLTVDAADVKKAVNKAYKDAAEKYNFQGFRRGRAPRPVIDGLLGKDAILAQATEDLLNAASPLILEELDVVPVGQLDFGTEPVLCADGQDYVVDFSFGVRPTCELESYDAPAINMPPEEVTDAELEYQVKQLLDQFSTYEDVEEDRAVAAEDVVSVDIENVEGAESVAGDGRMIDLKAAGVPAELKEGLVGMSKGESKEITWSEAHGDHEHKHTIKVTLQGIKQLVAPELDDELAKKLGYDDVEAFKAGLREEVAADKKRSLPNLKQDRVVEALGKLLILEEVPEDYKNEILNETMQEVFTNVQRYGLSLDQYLAANGIEFGEFLSDMREQAEERARQSLALDALAAKLGIEVTEDDVKAEFANSNVEDIEAAIEEWRGAGRLPAIRDSIRRSKAVDWMVENSPVTIVDEIAERLANEAADAE